MEIHERIKELRETKKLSQEYISVKLALSQSQYSRRESGEIKFLADEITVIAQLLEVTVSYLYGEPSTTSFSINTQNGGNFGQYISLPDKLIEQYEARLKEKDELIELLRRKKD